MKSLHTATTITIIAAGILALLFETGALPEGILADATVAQQYVVDTMSALSVIVCLPLAVKLKGHPWWRWALLSVPVLANLGIYYLYINSLSLPCAAILAIALMMMWPGHNPVDD